ncbi:MAG: pentapeptide repeat-containing protein [Desulfovibrionaceae bacterium]|nr:pentapeptide repeat-containing protein [Desulfovibrionaceae bacterium]
MKFSSSQILILPLALAAVTGWHFIFTRQTAPPSRIVTETPSTPLIVPPASLTSPPRGLMPTVSDPESASSLSTPPKDLLGAHPAMLVVLRQRWDEEGIRTLGEDPARLNNTELRNAVLPYLEIKGKKLEGTSFINCDLGGLTLEDVECVGVTFRQTHLRYVRFKNVTFRDCRFENAGLEKADLENCRFLGGCLAGVKTPGEDRAPAAFKECRLQDVLFEAFVFDGASLQGISGRLILRKIVEVHKDPSFPTLNGNNLELLMEDCRFSISCSITGNYRVYARNCLFRRSDLHINGYNDGSPPGELKRVIRLENCELQDCYLSSDGLVLIRQGKISDYSTLASVQRSLWWLEGCTLGGEDGPVNLTGDAGTGMHIRGKGPESPPERLNIKSQGKISLLDLALQNPVFRAQGSMLRELNLRRTRLEGADLAKLRLLAGQWEDVELLPEVRLSQDTRLGALKVRKIRFPQGSPWRGMENFTLPPETPSLLWNEADPPDLGHWE